MDLAPIDDLGLPSWRYMRRLYTPARERFDRVATASFSSESLNLRPQQRLQLQNQLKAQSQAFIRTLQRLLASYPEQFDLALSERLLEELRKLREGLPVARVEQAPVRGQPRPRVFEADNLLLVGQPVPGEPDALVIPQVNNRQERWTRNARQEWVPAGPTTPVPRARPLAELAREAEQRLEELPALRQRLQRYANRRMLPADVEDLYLGECQELEYRINQLRNADSQNTHVALIERLQHQVEQLRDQGRLARVALCKASAKPSGGQLEYLAQSGEVDIRKIGTLQRSGTTPATRNWLQEYEVIDSRSGQPWCYAHFHYRHEHPRFDNFIAAHLKTPTQRLLGAANASNPEIWRGEISRQLARELFEPLFT
jgi:hypothetical protein